MDVEFARSIAAAIEQAQAEVWAEAAKVCEAWPVSSGE
jgi:hypothetical protein